MRSYNVEKRQHRAVFLCGLFLSFTIHLSITTSNSFGQPYGALEEFLAAAPPPPPEEACPLYTFDVTYLSLLGAGGQQSDFTADNLVTWPAASPGLSCLQNHIDEAIRRCEVYWHSGWDHWDSCIATGYFLGDVTYNNGATLDPHGNPVDIDAPTFVPATINCFGIEYTHATMPANCTDDPREGTFFLDEDCNSVIPADADAAASACETAIISWWGSPISLLWVDSVNIEDDIHFTQFPLDPSKVGKWYEWKASAEAPLLVYDPMHNGMVNSAQQLFGDWTFGGKVTAALNTTSAQLPILGEKWENGYQALAQLDRNKDGEISGVELEPLALWFDKNRDGVSQRGEVISVEEAKILALYYTPDGEDKSTRSITASRGFKRVLADGSEIEGRSVDWYGEFGESKQELIQKHIARAALCGGQGAEIEEILAKKLVSDLEKSEKDIRSVLGEAFSGVWDWQAVSGSTDQAKTAKGILTLSTRGTRLKGHSMLELSRGGRKAQRSVVSIFPLTGALVVPKEVGAGARIEFSVMSGGRSAGKSIARLSEDGKTLLGSTQVKLKYQGKAVDFSYKWRAKRHLAK